SAAMRRLWGRRENRGGMHASHGKIGTGVEEKQLVIHLRTLFQKTVILSCIVVLREKRSQPYVRIGRRRPIARRLFRYGGRPEPGEESCLTVAKAPWAKASRLVKWGVVSIEGVNQ